MKVLQTGFTLIELVVVIVVLGILSAVALPRFINLGDDADIAVVESTAGAFREAVNLAHNKWIILGSNTDWETNNDIPLYGPGDAGKIDFNATGWPAQSYARIDSVIELSNRDDCISVWNTILSDGTSKIDKDDEFTAVYGPYADDAHYVCHFQRTAKPNLYIRYDSVNGSVTVHK